MKRIYITCFFIDKKVRAKWLFSSHVTCISPNKTDPGDYKLIVKYENDRFQSDVLTYTYFADPD